MSFTIAIAGKGGSGKTTVSSLIIRHLLKTFDKPVLAVDADPNQNLGESLGLEVRETVGLMLDRFQKDKVDLPPGLTKEAYLEFQMNSLLVESRNLDLITMGRGEGQSCYCYPNTILRKFIDRLTESYAFIVMDNEAGMEHLSRGTTQDIDELLIISNHSVKGVRTLSRIRELVAELKLRVKHESIVINMVPGQVDPLITAEMERLGLKPDAFIPQSDSVFKFDLGCRSILDLPESDPAAEAVGRLITAVLTQKTKN